MSWRDQANCLDVDTDVFYRHEEARTPNLREKAAREAFTLCGACEVSTSCLDAALAEPGSQHGIRGNTWASARTAMVLDRRRGSV